VLRSKKLTIRIKKSPEDPRIGARPPVVLCCAAGRKQCKAPHKDNQCEATSHHGSSPGAGAGRQQFSNVFCMKCVSHTFYIHVVAVSQLFSCSL
jgi:hypothetical protein